LWGGVSNKTRGGGNPIPELGRNPRRKQKQTYIPCKSAKGEKSKQKSPGREQKGLGKPKQNWGKGGAFKTDLPVGKCTYHKISLSEYTRRLIGL